MKLIKPSAVTSLFVSSIFVYGALAHAVASPQSNESFKKITRAPKQEVPGGASEGLVVDEHGNIVSDAPLFPRPEVISEPAPGFTRQPLPEETSETATPPEKEEAVSQAPEKTSGHGPASVSSAVSAPAKTAKEVPKETAKESSKETPAAPHAAASATNTETVTAEQSLRWLGNGNARFVKRNFRADGRSPADRLRLTEGQHPHAIILSCSDSRAPAELVFDQALGEVLSVRVSGEALDSSVIATIEDGIERLGIKLIVVMGHSRCDAVEAAINAKDEDTKTRTEAQNKLIASLQSHFKTIDHDKLSSNLETEATVNADATARDLTKLSDVIRRKVAAGELVIKTALYRLDSGKVTFY